MKPIWLLLIGVVLGWAASGVDWSREAVGQESSPPPAGAERSIRRGDGVLRRRGLLPQRDSASPSPTTDAPAFTPNADAESMPNVPPGLDAQQKTGVDTLQIGETIAGPVLEPVESAVPEAILPGRYQVSAYGNPQGHGCYITDTVTGRTWHVNNAQAPQVVTEALSR
ncbi:hypothetical protein [Lacipirellula sp.]|uniref:hypothetical protein n=1 Tax=Lacipirellula sp. TaxID=2691419 RepID=UPI003D0F40A7